MDLSTDVVVAVGAHGSSGTLLVESALGSRLESTSAGTVQTVNSPQGTDSGETLVYVFKEAGRGMFTGQSKNLDINHMSTNDRVNCGMSLLWYVIQQLRRRPDGSAGKESACKALDM